MRDYRIIIDLQAPDRHEALRLARIATTAVHGIDTEVQDLGESE